MNQQAAKKLKKYARKYSKRNWLEYVQAVKQWPFSARLRFAWFILFGKGVS